MKALAYFTSSYYIKGFFGPNRFLSNFYPSPIRLTIINDGNIKEYSVPTSENLYQRMKASFCKQTSILSQFETCSPSEAKNLGRSFEMTETQKTAWDLRKNYYMRQCVYYKFAQNPDLLKQLLATRGKYLEEANTWGDSYWGVSYHHSGPDGIKNDLGDYLKPEGGQNMLGNILMYTREEFFMKENNAL